MGMEEDLRRKQNGERPFFPFPGNLVKFKELPVLSRDGPQVSVTHQTQSFQSHKPYQEIRTPGFSS